MKPFDLEAAKRGEPLITRDGRKAWFVGMAPDEAGDVARPVAIWVSGSFATYALDGSFYGRTPAAHKDGADLFMAPRKQVRYLIVWRNKCNEITAELCDDERHCNSRCDVLRHHGHTVLTHGQKIEWEE